LQHHEEVLRSSVQTIDRYRAATEHLLRFLEVHPVRGTSQFQASHAEEFIRFLRTTQVSPNGHCNTVKRPLMDKGVRYILECCRALFNYAAKRRHLSPYAENPFHTVEIDRIPVEEIRPITLFTGGQEKAFLEACDDWQFPLFLTLLLTGLRPGELTHLLLPDDLDLGAQLLRVRNKPRLGWQVKTRNERDVPLVQILVDVLRIYVGERHSGPAFLRRRWTEAAGCRLLYEQELSHRIAQREAQTGLFLRRKGRLRVAQKLWRDLGAVEADRIRVEFMRLTKRIGLPRMTAPKMLRHQFATALQQGKVDPLIRNELMGHVGIGARTAGHGLAMTAVYTHTQPETRREQLEAAMCGRPAVLVAEQWVRRHQSNGRSGLVNQQGPMHRSM
jgi:integrase